MNMFINGKTANVNIGDKVVDRYNVVRTVEFFCNSCERTVYAARHDSEYRDGCFLQECQIVQHIPA